MGNERNLDWIYSTPDNETLSHRYDEWAEDYDQTLKDWGWTGPKHTVDQFAKFVKKDAQILDVGAGSGMVGEVLHQMGYTNLSALDLSKGMLDVARGKNVYRELYEMRLGEHLDFVDNTFDAIIAVGVFTLGHAPAHSLDELLRIIRPKGHLCFLTRKDVFEEHGFGEKLGAMEKEGRVKLRAVSEALETLPNEKTSVKQWARTYQIRS